MLGVALSGLFSLEGVSTLRSEMFERRNTAGTIPIAEREKQAGVVQDTQYY